MNTVYRLSEHEIQASFFQEVLYQYRLRDDFLPPLFYAVLNGAWMGGSSKLARLGLVNKYKAEGWRSGIADVMYDQPRGRYNKMVIEFKREDKRGAKEKGVLTGGLSPEQIEYLKSIKSYAFVRVVYTVEEALAAFTQYMALPAFGSSEEWSVEEILNGVEK